MAVVFDNSNGVFNNEVTSPHTSTLNVGSGSNRALVVAIALNNRIVVITSVTWDSGGTNQAMTQITSLMHATDNVGITIWGLVNPTSGNKTLSVAFTGGSPQQTKTALISYTGVDQTGGATTFPHANTASGTSAAPSVTITSATGNAIVALHANVESGGVDSVSDTEVFRDNNGSINFGSNRVAGSASHAMTAALSASSEWISAGTDVVADAPAATLMGQAVM